jgi:hypothetical protein
MKLVDGSSEISIEVTPNGSMADDSYLRGHMAKVGLGNFYDQIKPRMERGLAFTLREGSVRKRRTSEWITLPEGNLLLKFSGNGVLEWTPEELGVHSRELDPHGFTYNNVGVFLTPDGAIEKVVPRTSR